jgi:tRNA modification GTPase
VLAERQDLDAADGHWVLEGPPNAGKSTLLNALAGEERALVDAAPGTTRDVLSAPFRAGGRRITLWDTAGQHAGAAGVEARGIEKGRALAERASLRLWLLGPEVIWPNAQGDRAGGPLWLLASHADALAPAQRQAIAREAAARDLFFAGFVSVPTGEGMAELVDLLAAQLGRADHAQAVAMNARHVGHVESALAALEQAGDDDAAGAPETVLLADLEAALSALESIAGQGVEQAVFEQIFRRFCVGK